MVLTEERYHEVMKLADEALARFIKSIPADTHKLNLALVIDCAEYVNRYDSANVYGKELNRDDYIRLTLKLDVDEIVDRLNIIETYINIAAPLAMLVDSLKLNEIELRIFYSRIREDVYGMNWLLRKRHAQKE